MKYTYRDECIIPDGETIAIIAVVIIGSCGVLWAYLKANDPMAFIFAIPIAAIALSCYFSIHKNRKAALATRRKALAEGTRYSGKIVDAGVDWDKDEYREYDENGNSENKVKWRKYFWADVEYFNTQIGKTMRFRARYMRRTLKGFIGSSVDVYTWEELSKYDHMNIMKTYVDTFGLN